MKITRQCCVPSCNEANDRKFSFFRFPASHNIIKKWKNAIGLPQAFMVDCNTFVCVKHFIEKDIAQHADRKVGQRARLKYGSIPRLLLDPIKIEIEEKDDGLNRSQNDGFVQTIKKDIFKNSTDSSFVPVKNSEQKLQCNENLKRSVAKNTDQFSFITNIRNRFSYSRSRVKVSKILSVIPPIETIYSSESDCEYEIAVTVKRTEMNTKIANPQNVDSNEANSLNEQREQLNPKPHSPVAKKEVQNTTNSVCSNEEGSNQIKIKYDLEEILKPALILKPRKIDYIEPIMKHKKFDCGRLFKKRRSEYMYSSRNQEHSSNQVDKSSNEKGIHEVEQNPFHDINLTSPSLKTSEAIESSCTERCYSTNNTLMQDSDDEAIDGQIRAFYECNICKDMFLSTSKVNIHLNGVHNQEDCKLFQFYKTYPYKNIKPVNGLRAYACSVCLMMYYNVQSLKKHQIITHGALLGLGEVEVKTNPVNSNIHVCHVCQKSFLDPENLRSHLLLHRDQKNNELSVYKCDQCGLGFEYEAALTKHTIENHATLHLFSCDLCSEKFGSTTDLHEHKKNHSFKDSLESLPKNSEICLACPEEGCDSFYKDSRYYYSHILYQHRRVYQDDPKFIEFLATIDPEGLSFDEIEKGSDQGDENIKFSCKLCDRKFTHYSFLKAHELGKSNIRYECPECDIKSCSKICLVRHYNVYHNSKCEKLHFCSECPKSFTMKSDLLLHMNNHRPKSQKIFNCSLNSCDRVFADEETYKYHVARLHGQKRDGDVPIREIKSLNSNINQDQSMLHYFANNSDNVALSSTFMPVINDVCNEVTISTDI